MECKGNQINPRKVTKTQMIEAYKGKLNELVELEAKYANEKAYTMDMEEQVQELTDRLNGANTFIHRLLNISESQAKAIEIGMEPGSKSPPYYTRSNP